MLKINDQEFNELTNFIKGKYGIDLGQKKALIEGRLSSLVYEKGFRSFSEYFKFVKNDLSTEEMTVLVNKLTTNHTFFMRESSHFKYLKEVALPNLEKNIKDGDFRIWCAGCSSGEEAYTLAMILDDYFVQKKPPWDKKLLATDISIKVLEKAEQGIYEQEGMEELPTEWLKKYFSYVGNHRYKVNEELKHEIIFRIFNLMDPIFPFKRKFHTIFCRNVMIYFDLETKINLINKFNQLTEPGGYLFIGHSETLPKEVKGYKYVMPSVYRKESI